MFDENNLPINASVHWKSNLRGQGASRTTSLGGCFKNANETDVIVNLFAYNYTPVTFTVHLIPDTMTHITVPLTPICSEQSVSYFEQYDAVIDAMSSSYLSSFFIYDIDKEELKTQTRDGFFTGRYGLNQSFGLLREEVTLDCVEAFLSRGGHRRATGTVGDAYFELVHSSGPCSSGGAGCWNTYCFSTDSEDLFSRLSIIFAQKTYIMKQI